MLISFCMLPQVYAYVGDSYPRYVGADRGKDNYQPVGNQTRTKPIGKIPQVAHTYQYFDACFGMMNEHGVAMQESTCTARTKGAKPRTLGGAALWYTDELSRVALERCTTARCSVQLMGELAVAGGFYGEDNVEGTGESLIVTDSAEAWVFHVLASDSNGTSAVWAAQRVPEGHVAVVPNIFQIRGMDLSDGANYLASPNIHALAVKNKWWDPAKEPFDFTKAYSDGEYNHRYYSGRRWWGAMKMLVPAARFVWKPDYEDLRLDAPYPFSVDARDPTTGAGTVASEDVAGVMRSFYEGTPFDQTAGMAAGPFGNPNRYDGMVASPGQPGIRGAWERTIAIYRTTYSFVSEFDDRLPASTGAVMWWGPLMAATTPLVPFFAGQDSLPLAYSVGHKGGPIDKSSAMWASRFVQMTSNIRFDHMYADIRELEGALHGTGREMVTQQQRASAAGHLPKGVSASALAAAANAHAAMCVKSWWALADHLMYKYADGQIYADTPSTVGAGAAKPAGYPVWWLRAVGYADGPPPPVAGVVVQRSIY